MSVASEPDAELRRENDELRSEVLRLRESLALADAKRATAERELRDAREDAAAARAPAAGGAQHPGPAPAASADIARRLERSRSRRNRLGAMKARNRPGPPGKGASRVDAWNEGRFAKQTGGDRFAVPGFFCGSESDEDLRRANICHFHRQWHL